MIYGKELEGVLIGVGVRSELHGTASDGEGKIKKAAIDLEISVPVSTLKMGEKLDKIFYNKKREIDIPISKSGFTPELPKEKKSKVTISGEGFEVVIEETKPRKFKFKEIDGDWFFCFKIAEMFSNDPNFVTWAIGILHEAIKIEIYPIKDQGELFEEPTEEEKTDADGTGEEESEISDEEEDFDDTDDFDEE